MTTPWSVPRDWKGQTAAILASGPSLTREQCEAVRDKCRVIAVNNQGIDTVDSVSGQLVQAMAPWADVLFAADIKWWNHYQDRALKFEGRKVCIVHRRNFPQVYSLQRSSELVFDPRPTHLVFGGNSGYMALHLAVHFGAKRILLCGYDMKDSGGRKHWFGNHSGKLNSKARYHYWIRSFDRLAPRLAKMKVEVINCSTNTALRCFPRTTLEKALNGS